ncbi:sensor histidine kinase [Jatrophihabitans fulvus]
MTAVAQRDAREERADTETLLACQSEVLARMSSGSPLPAVLDVITGTLERLLPGSACSLLLLDGGVLRHGSAPSLPADYSSAIDGLAPGPDEGACGAAAYGARPVVIRDVHTDPRWARYRHLADAAGLRACWSSPILGAHGDVTGTFAVYHRHVHEPDGRERRVVAHLTGLAGVAIEHAGMVRRLTVSEERFRRAFEDTAVGLALLDTDGRVTSANAALQDLLGRDAGDLVGTALADHVDADDRPRFAAAVRRVAGGRERSSHAEVRTVRRDDGPETVVVATVSLVRGAEGEPVQLSATVLDVTARRAAQRERQARLEAELARRSAEAASRAKSEFLSAVSHEMRTPLQAITGFAELLGTLELDAARREQALRHIGDGAGHLLSLVDDTLDLARIEAGALPLCPEPVDAEALLDEVVAFLAPVADRYGVRVRRAPGAATVRADRRRLRQVLINLVSNGIRYSGPAGVVTVRAGASGDTVRLEVSDDGPGIAPGVRERLFQPFQCHPDRSGDGVGLGLMLALGLAEAMGGSLALGDGADGGTCAVVVLPQG